MDWSLFSGLSGRLGSTPQLSNSYCLHLHYYLPLQQLHYVVNSKCTNKGLGLQVSGNYNGGRGGHCNASIQSEIDNTDRLPVIQDGDISCLISIFRQTYRYSWYFPKLLRKMPLRVWPKSGTQASIRGKSEVPMTSQWRYQRSRMPVCTPWFWRCMTRPETWLTPDVCFCSTTPLLWNWCLPEVSVSFMLTRGKFFFLLDNSSSL